IRKKGAARGAPTCKTGTGSFSEDRKPACPFQQAPVGRGPVPASPLDESPRPVSNSVIRGETCRRAGTSDPCGDLHRGGEEPIRNEHTEASISVRAVTGGVQSSS